MKEMTYGDLEYGDEFKISPDGKQIVYDFYGHRTTELDYHISKEPHVEGTRRMFIRDSHIWMHEPEGVCCFNIKQAWSFTPHENDEENLKAIADKYNVDIRLFGIECGMEFIQEVIVHHGNNSEKGKIVLNNCIQFEDWAWECPFPEMGG